MRAKIGYMSDKICLILVGLCEKGFEMFILKHLFSFIKLTSLKYRFYGLVVRVPGYRSRGLGSISSATRFSGK
jgi:hypothetical protein